MKTHHIRFIVSAFAILCGKGALQATEDHQGTALGAIVGEETRQRLQNQYGWYAEPDSEQADPWGDFMRHRTRAPTPEALEPDVDELNKAVAGLQSAFQNLQNATDDH